MKDAVVIVEMIVLLNELPWAGVAGVTRDGRIVAILGLLLLLLDMCVFSRVLVLWAAAIAAPSKGEKRRHSALSS